MVQQPGNKLSEQGFVEKSLNIDGVFVGKNAIDKPFIENGQLNADPERDFKLSGSDYDKSSRRISDNKQDINTKTDILTNTDFHFGHDQNGKNNMGKIFGNSQDGNPNTPDIPVTGTNIDPWLAVVASVLIAGGSFFVGKGYLTSSALAQIAGAILSLMATAFVAWQTTTNKKITSLAKTLDVPKTALKRHIVALRNTHASNKGN